MPNPITVATVVGIAAILYVIAVGGAICALWLLMMEEARDPHPPKRIAHRAATTTGRTRKATAATTATRSGPRHARSTWRSPQPGRSE